MTRVTAVSSARMVWVLRAMRAEKGVGSAIASSEGVGVKALGAAEDASEGLDRGAHDVFVRILRLQAIRRRSGSACAACWTRGRAA